MKLYSYDEMPDYTRQNAEEKAYAEKYLRPGSEDSIQYKYYYFTKYWGCYPIRYDKKKNRFVITMGMKDFKQYEKTGEFPHTYCGIPVHVVINKKHNFVTERE